MDINAAGGSNAGIADEKIAALADYGTSPHYTEAERVALELADAMCAVPVDVSDDLFSRLRGHYEGDPQRYREALAADEWQELDPILRLQRRLGHDGFESEARAEVEEAVEWARSRPFPSPDLVEELVYA